MNHTTIALTLLRIGADVNAKTSQGNSPLHVTTFPGYDGNVAMIKALLANGADVNAVTNTSMTTLSFVDKRRADVIQALRAEGAR